MPKKQKPHLDVIKYEWWGNSNSPPENLKTKTQLSELGYSPVSPVGIIYTKKYDLYLYDINNPMSTKPKRKLSENQLKTLEANRIKAKIKRDYERWELEYGWIEKDRVAAVLWSREKLSIDNWCILDTETTGLDDAEIVEIAIISHTGETLLETLVKPTISIPLEASNIHGLIDKDVINSPTFPDIYPLIVSTIHNKEVLIYNADFDIRVLAYCCTLHQLPKLELSKKSDCVMHWFAQWRGIWSSYFGSYKWEPLQGGHRALSDCQAVLHLIKTMAQDSNQISCPVPIPE